MCSFTYFFYEVLLNSDIRTLTYCPRCYLNPLALICSTEVSFEGKLSKPKFLTHSIWETQPSFIRSIWNMDEIFGLKVSFIICTPTTNSFFEIPSCAKHVIFISEFDNFGENPPLYDIKNNFEMSACAWRNFKNIFF